MKYKVVITLVAKQTFTFEVDAPNIRKAEDAAYDLAIDRFTSTAQAAEQDDIEVEQLTRDCERCGNEFNIYTSDGKVSDEVWEEDSDYCAACGKLIEAEENYKRYVETFVPIAPHVFLKMTQEKQLEVLKAAAGATS